jgi:hypothetical protein
MLTVKFIENDRGNPPGKLADVELHFTDTNADCPTCRGTGEVTIATDGPLAGASGLCTACDHGTINSPLAGLKLIGFAIWERRTAGGRNVTFPARAYSVNGERRSFALLRPLTDTAASDRLRDYILNAYEEHEEQKAREERERRQDDKERAELHRVAPLYGE